MTILLHLRRIAALTAAIAAQASTPAILSFGTNSGPGASQTRYLFPWFQASAADTTERVIPVPYAGTISRLYAHNHAAVNIDSGSMLINVRKNGVNTALTLAWTDNSSYLTNVANSFTVDAGDLVSVQVIGSADYAGDQFVTFLASMQLVAS